MENCRHGCERADIETATRDTTHPCVTRRPTQRMATGASAGIAFHRGEQELRNGCSSCRKAVAIAQNAYNALPSESTCALSSTYYNNKRHRSSPLQICYFRNGERPELFCEGGVDPKRTREKGPIAVKKRNTGSAAYVEQEHILVRERLEQERRFGARMEQERFYYRTRPTPPYALQILALDLSQRRNC
jgi:hypothetical protein